MEDESYLLPKNYCKYCEAQVLYKPIYVYEWEAQDGCPEEYTLAKCSICGEPVLFFRDEIELQQELLEIDLPEYQLIWPPNERTFLFHVPQAVHFSYHEAVAAEKAKLWLSASVMIGRTLEAVCKDFDPTCKTIAQGIKHMKEAGILSEEMYAWSNELRIIRNKGAHVDNEGMSAEDVSDALDFLTAILEVIYNIRPKFESFKKRQINRNSVS